MTKPTDAMNSDLITYLTWKRDKAKENGTAVCESFTFDELDRMVNALAAAEVGCEDEDNILNWMPSIKKVLANVEAATIERCAKVADKMATEIETHSYQDTATRLAAEMLRKSAAAIRALKDKP